MSGRPAAILSSILVLFPSSFASALPAQAAAAGDIEAEAEDAAPGGGDGAAAAPLLRRAVQEGQQRNIATSRSLFDQYLAELNDDAGDAVRHPH